MVKGLSIFQIGKNGVNDKFIETLNSYFKKNRVVRISVLKNASRNREEIVEMAGKISQKCDGNFRFKIIGFKIILRKIKGQDL
jgi:RNA-binding protein YhbY